MDVDHARRNPRRVVPNRFENLRARDEPALGFAEKPHEAKLERRERHATAVAGERKKIAIEVRTAEIEAITGFVAPRHLRAPAYERTDSRNQFVCGERSRDAVVSAAFECAQYILAPRSRAHQQH